MKARRTHIVPLAPMARELFQTALAGRSNGAGVFGSRFSNRVTRAPFAVPRTTEGYRSTYRQDNAAASLANKPPTPHDLRRTVATGLSKLGVPREDRLAILAHVAGDIHGAVYDHYERLKEKRAALVAWEAPYRDGHWWGAAYDQNGGDGIRSPPYDLPEVERLFLDGDKSLILKAVSLVCDNRESTAPLGTQSLCPSLPRNR